MVLPRSKFIIFAMLIVMFCLGYLIRNVEKRGNIPPGKDKCITCHNNVSDPGKSHPIKAFGCYECHLGNPYATDKISAHTGMVDNPGDMEVVNSTCGKAKCHRKQAQRVSRSLMATNKGIIGTLLERWEGKTRSVYDITYLKKTGKSGSLALDLYVKMCAGCHLWQKRYPHDGWPRNRGGGCSACHTTEHFEKLVSANVFYKHPTISSVIPVKNCLRCHNRSARIGLSYIGVYESSGYGTPFNGNSPSKRELPGNRFYLQLPSDVHWKQHRMLCIDCHTGKGLMGDGNSYNHFEEQVEITCRTCHLPDFHRASRGGDLAPKLASANGKISLSKNSLIAYGKKNSPIYNLQKRNGKFHFFTKRNGKEIKFRTFGKRKPYHNLKGHKRLKCQACHSRWMPQCYGCHYVYTENQIQKDWLWGKKSPGRWKEYRYFIRFETPTLGVDYNDSITPFSPCQVLVRKRSAAGKKPVFAGIKHMIMSAFDPHTTSAESRTCLDCHTNPKTIGLGLGILRKEKDKWSFLSVFGSGKNYYSFDHPPDAFVNLDGKPLQSGYRPGSRPFSKKELKAILSVSECLECHSDYNDAIYAKFNKSYELFAEGRTPCKVGKRSK